MSHTNRHCLRIALSDFSAGEMLGVLVAEDSPFAILVGSHVGETFGKVDIEAESRPLLLSVVGEVECNLLLFTGSDREGVSAQGLSFCVYAANHHQHEGEGCGHILG